MAKQAAHATLTDPAKSAPFTDLTRIYPADITWMHAEIDYWADLDEMTASVDRAKARADQLAASEAAIVDMEGHNPALDQAAEALGIEHERASRIFQCLNWAGLAWREALACED
jgi:hypothetical protein